MIKHLLISIINDESIVVLADSLRGIIVVRGLPHCLSFEVTLLCHPMSQKPYPAFKKRA